MTDTKPFTGGCMSCGALDEKIYYGGEERPGPVEIDLADPVGDWCSITWQAGAYPRLLQPKTIIAMDMLVTNYAKDGMPNMARFFEELSKEIRDIQSRAGVTR